MLTKNQVSGKQQQCRCGWWSPPRVCYVNETAKPFSANEWDLQLRSALIGLTSTLADPSRLHASVCSPAACQKDLTVGSIIAPVWMQQIAQTHDEKRVFSLLDQSIKYRLVINYMLGFVCLASAIAACSSIQSDRHSPPTCRPSCRSTNGFVLPAPSATRVRGPTAQCIKSLS